MFWLVRAACHHCGSVWPCLCQHSIQEVDQEVAEEDAEFLLGPKKARRWEDGEPTDDGSDNEKADKEETKQAGFGAESDDSSSEEKEARAKAGDGQDGPDGRRRQQPPRQRTFAQESEYVVIEHRDGCICGDSSKDIYIYIYIDVLCSQHVFGKQVCNYANPTAYSQSDMSRLDCLCWCLTTCDNTFACHNICALRQSL